MHGRVAVSLCPQAAWPVVRLANLLLVRDRYFEALRLCEDALERITAPRERAELLLWKAGCQFGPERNAAWRTLHELRGLPLSDKSHDVAAELWARFGVFHRAEFHAERAWRIDPEQGARTFASLARWAERFQRPGAVATYHRRVRAYDLSRPVAPWALDDARCQEVIDDALEELSALARRRLVDVAVFLEEFPSEDDIAMGMPPRILGRFCGRKHGGEPVGHSSFPHLPRIYIYRRCHEWITASAEEMAAQIRITTLHETGHFFGMDEWQLAAVGLG
jgi:predicted Zn-dependent protease with MMP-like domain